ncbi:MAG: hypothetical protein HYZ84_01530 [Candidatus Omnitrophica bacterium]|nr:hypothetical protein [Candidatus Omnitrophota bacterium]
MIEVIVTAVIVSFLGTIIYTTFLGGNRIWRYAMMGSAESEIDYFLEKLTVDLRNAFPFTANILVGAPASLQFYTRIPAGEKSVLWGKVPLQQPVRVRYHFEQDSHEVQRTQETYQQMLLPSTIGEDQTDQVAGDIRGIAIHYDMSVNKPTPGQWVSYWNRPCLPRAIKLDIEYGKDKAEKTMSRIIPVPAGGCAPPTS